MFKIQTTEQFRADFRLQLSRGPDLAAFKDVIRHLEKQLRCRPGTVMVSW